MGKNLSNFINIIHRKLPVKTIDSMASNSVDITKGKL
jgi:hypothetical protein